MRITAVIPAALAAGITLAPVAHADGDEPSLVAAVRQVYEQVQRGCTPRTPPQFQRIVWNSPYPTGQGGTGRIIDAAPGLGGPFHVWWDNTEQPAPAGTFKVPAQPRGYWDVTLEFC
ncbi:hypothetical protein [Mycobacterium sp. 94-17]|uniref:hypothetical protein n=1 Tax=Mycobacterium sp. 94-17 TaxID=2986147 RepID=UPI002D1EFECB|nr:hypothetical protein [Mycobacterium sp. 94-17]MEB4211479.1 hypothetical protein [Mycobacterium sp. 94-17]